MTDTTKLEDATASAKEPSHRPYESPTLEFVGNVRSILADGGSLPAFDGLPATSGTMGA